MSASKLFLAIWRLCHQKPMFIQQQQYTRPSVNFSCLFLRKVDFLAKDNRKKSGPCALQCLARSVGNSVRSQVVDDAVSLGQRCVRLVVAGADLL